MTTLNALLLSSEAEHQTALFDFLSSIELVIPEVRWAFHPANGGYRHKRVAGQMKAQGVKRGVPDVLLPIRRGPFVGFVCELKYGKNATTPEQDLWLEHLEAQGWCCVVAWSWDQAARELLTYLGVEPKEYGL